MGQCQWTGTGVQRSGIIVAHVVRGVPGQFRRRSARFVPPSSPPPSPRYSLNKFLVFRGLGEGGWLKIGWNVEVSRRIVSGKELGASCWSGPGFLRLRFLLCALSGDIRQIMVCCKLLRLCRLLNSSENDLLTKDFSRENGGGDRKYPKSFRRGGRGTWGYPAAKLIGVRGLPGLKIETWGTRFHWVS